MLMALSIALDIFFTFLLLLLSWIITDKAPMLNRFVILTNGYDNPIPDDEPAWVMVVFIWLLPMTYLLLVHFLARRSFIALLLLALSWVNALALTIFITALARYFLPVARPYFATKCAAGIAGGYMMDTNFCTTHMTRHDMQSFPSGHTSLVWASWLFVMFALTFLTRTFSRTGNFWKLVLFFLAPLIVPIWMSCDRVRTGEHSPHDVGFGILIGLIASVATFFNMDRQRLFPQAA